MPREATDDREVDLSVAGVIIPSRKATKAYSVSPTMKLDPDEKELLESVQRGEWKSAKVTGLPYQTLIATLLHRYAAGRLKESYRPHVGPRVRRPR